MSPYRASIDLVLDARAVIDRMAAAETADEQQRHTDRLATIKRRYIEDTAEECEQHREYLRRIEKTRKEISDLQRQMAAQLSVVGYPRQATPELVAVAYEGAGG